MSESPTVHQCPSCELRFRYRTELVDHVRRDHPDRALEDDPYHRHPTPPDEPRSD